MAIPGVSLAILKARLGIAASDVSSDQLLNGILCGAERSAVVYLGYDPNSATSTEYYSGEGSEFITLRRKPVTSVTSVHEDFDGRYGEADDPFLAETLLVEGADYSVKTDGGTQTGILIRIGRFWPYSHRRPPGRLGWELSPEFGSVKVTYVAGYSADKLADIAEAILALAATMWQRRDGLGPTQSESLDGRSLSFGDGSMSDSVGIYGPALNAAALGLLHPHRLVPWA